MPWCPDSLATSSFPSRKGVPPWTIQLELHYQKFHPQTWLTLAADDAIDSWFYRKVLQERDKQIAVYGEAHDSIQSALDAVLLRRYTRWGTIFALHGIRQIYLDTQLALHPAWTEPEALKGLEVGDYPLVSPVAAVGTVWPLPSEPPREDLLTTLHSIDHAILFDHETPESRRAQPSGWGRGLSSFCRAVDDTPAAPERDCALAAAWHNKACS
ncbi:hypothetical protein JCM10021v2_007769 [Rhodotorula toruloides]